MNRKDSNYRSGSVIAIVLALALTACAGEPALAGEPKGALAEYEGLESYGGPAEELGDLGSSGGPAEYE